MCSYECLSRCAHTHTKDEIFGLGTRRMWNAGVFSQRALSDTLQACPALEVLHGLSICTLSCCWLTHLCASHVLYFRSVCLKNTFVDKHQLSLQKKFEKTETFTAASWANSWPCLLPNSRKANTSSACLKGAGNVDSDKKILLSWFFVCLFFCLFCLV